MRRDMITCMSVRYTLASFEKLSVGWKAKETRAAIAEEEGGG